MKMPLPEIWMECVGGPLDGHRARMQVEMEGFEKRTILFRWRRGNECTVDAYGWTGRVLDDGAAVMGYVARVSKVATRKEGGQ